MGGAGGCHGASLGFESLGTFTVRMLVGALVTFVLVIVVSLLAFWHAGCPKGGFQCRDGQCLARSRRCDNENNCSEREDEEDCMLPDNVDVKHLYFPATSTAPCRICVCPAPNSLQECALPSPPHLSLSHCHLTANATTHSSSSDTSGIKFPHTTSARLPQSSIEGPLRRRERSAIGGRKTQDSEERRSARREAVMDTYRRKRTRRIRTFPLHKKKNASATRVILAGNYERDGSTAPRAAQSGRSAYDSIKTSTAPTGSLHGDECLARCPSHRQGCHHAEGFMDKKITPSSFLKLRRTRRVKFLERANRGVVLKRDSSSGVISQWRSAQNAFRTSGRDIRDTTPTNTEPQPGNKTMPSCPHDTRTRRRRQATEDVADWKTTTNPQSNQTSGNMDFDNATVASPNMTLGDLEANEGDREMQGDGDGAAVHPEVLVQQPGEVRDSCHCELSHLTCVGTHMRNISARIVGVMKQLTVTLDDAATLEDKVLTRFTNLRTLSHTSGGLTKLPHRLFASLHFLEHLYLTGNKIREVEEDTCLGLGVLKVLFINRNEITSFDLACFQYTPALQDLYLNNNRLASITDSLLLQLTAIRTLDLRDNRITTVHPRALSSLTHLRHL